MKKSNADFIYKMGKIDREYWLLIVDKNQGNMSVTNDIENVVEDICETLGIPFSLLDNIVYRDSTGQWTGWNLDGFYPFIQRKAIQLSNQLNLY